MTISDVARELVTHPIRALVYRWNWKSAALSVAIRAALFFGANATEGLRAAAAAAAIECALMLPLVGTLAAAVQQFRAVEPAWKAAVATAFVIPLVTQAAEFTVHWLAGTPRLGTSILASTTLSVLSTMFSLFAMRRGVMIVGRGSRRFVDDLKLLPITCLQFLAVPIRRC